MKAIYVPAGTERSEAEFKLWGLATLHTKLSAVDTEGRLFVCEIMETDGFGPPRHLHYEQDEWFFITRGTFRIEVGGELFEAQAGDSIFAPRNVPHTWAPTGSGICTMVFVLQPAGSFESFLHQGSLLGRLPNPREANAIFEAHGMKITGPPLDVATTGFEGA